MCLPCVCLCIRAVYLYVFRTCAPHTPENLDKPICAFMLFLSVFVIEHSRRLSENANGSEEEARKNRRNNTVFVCVGRMLVLNDHSPQPYSTGTHIFTDHGLFSLRLLLLFACVIRCTFVPDFLISVCIRCLQCKQTICSSAMFRRNFYVISSVHSFKKHSYVWREMEVLIRRTHTAIDR